MVKPENLAAGHTAMAFGTPVASYVWPDSEDLNAALARCISQRAEKESGIRRSNVGGWHSKPDLLQWPDEGIAELQDRITHFAKDITSQILSKEVQFKGIGMMVEAWANLTKNGDYNDLHDHPGAHWSGVYYVASGNPHKTPPTNGRLELFDPRGGIHMVPLPGSLLKGRMLIDPMPGLMVFFPSWLKHSVHPFSGTGTRISISFNVTIRPSDIPS